MHVYLVRHTEYKNPDGLIPMSLPFELSEEGIKHAKKIGTYFQSKKIKHVFSSPIQRAKQTAEIIAESLGLEPMVNDAFREIEKPHLEGTVRGKREFCLYTEDGGETTNQIATRMQTGLSKILNHTDKNMVVVSHGDPITILLYSLIRQTIPTRPSHGQDCYIQKGEIIQLTVSDRQVLSWESFHV